MVLAAAQLQIGAVVNIRVVEQGFSSGSKDNDIDDLIESFEPAANVVFAKSTWTRCCTPASSLHLWDV